MVVARDVGGPQEEILVTTLGELDTAEVDMRTLLVIGSSTTRSVRRADGTLMVYTPRHHAG